MSHSALPSATGTANCRTKAGDSSDHAVGGNTSLDVHPAPLGVVATQADLQYLAAPVNAIFNPPSATGMGFWSINPYVGCAFGCAYCYARDTHRWQLERAGGAGMRVAESLPAWLAFERRILVKQNAAAKVREALRSTRSPKAGDKLVIGTATDPYQPAERHQGITRGVLEALGDVRGLSITIITKSPLVTRDVDLLARLTARNRVTVHISLITLDRDLARRIEPRAPTPDSRLRAVRRLSDAGIDVGVNCMPVLPGITDRPQALADLVKRVAEAGASHLATASLRLKPSAKRRYLMLMRESFPELTQRYLSAYSDGAHINKAYKTGLSEYMHKLCDKHGLNTRQYRYDGEELMQDEHEKSQAINAARTVQPEVQLLFEF
ncbi:MAG: radical SAM protein [Phycisphaerae bacterium]|nr:radical SAM protein [Gemmatimonadaceae bacterium]